MINVVFGAAGPVDIDRVCDGPPNIDDSIASRDGGSPSNDVVFAFDDPSIGIDDGGPPSSDVPVDDPLYVDVTGLDVDEPGVLESGFETPPFTNDTWFDIDDIDEVDDPREVVFGPPPYIDDPVDAAFKPPLYIDDIDDPLGFSFGPPPYIDDPLDAISEAPLYIDDSPDIMFEPLPYIDVIDDPLDAAFEPLPYIDDSLDIVFGAPPYIDDEEFEDESLPGIDDAFEDSPCIDAPPSMGLPLEFPPYIDDLDSTDQPGIDVVFKAPARIDDKVLDIDGSSDSGFEAPAFTNDTGLTNAARLDAVDVGGWPRIDDIGLCCPAPIDDMDVGGSGG